MTRWGEMWQVGCAGSDRIVAKGKTSDLKGAEVVFTGAVNDVPTTEVLLKEGFKEHRFGAGTQSCLLFLCPIVHTPAGILSIDDAGPWPVLRLTHGQECEQ